MLDAPLADEPNRVRFGSSTVAWEAKFFAWVEADGAD